MQLINWITQSINSIINWLSSNSTEIILGIAVAFILGVILIIISTKAKTRFEKEQRTKGLIKFVDRLGNEKWGTSQEIEVWKTLNYEEEQKDKGLVKFISKDGTTTWKSPLQIDIFEKEQFEEEQKMKGLAKFVDRLKNEKWGTPQQVKTWEKEDKETELKESIYYRVIKSIEGFEPSRRYRNEFGYHTELQGWLKAQFPSAKVEIQTGSSRPDIVIDNIALDTLSSKCLKYLNYYSHLVIVLFESNFSEGHYSEIVKGIENYSPNIRIIRKN
jgi:hypothetical protein